jgi:hypothetical protein
VAETNTLRTNVLTMMTDPAIKKFFGPQMSNADVQLMTSAGTTLNPELQSPEKLKSELLRLQDFVNRAKESLKVNTKFSSADYVIQHPEETQRIRQMIGDGKTDEEIGQIYGFSSVGGDTNTATLSKVISKEDGTNGGQCGRFVNQITGLGLGDSYKSKMAKMDSSITKPEPGMVFVMPYKDTGHTGFIVSVNNDGTATVKDSNYSLDEKVKTHKIALNKITGLARV